jgi:beta-phosphoglucomutase-like phosphatase (HAD superfamily)
MEKKRPLILTFDNGGLLVNSEAAFLDANKQTFLDQEDLLDAHGFKAKKYNNEEFVYHNILTSLGTKGYLKEKNIPDKVIDAIKNYRNKVFETIVTRKKETGSWSIDNRFEQIQALKNKFKDKIKVVLVTTSSLKKINKMHEGVAPEGLFDAYITKDDLDDPTHIKPFPDLYQLVTKKFPWAKKYLAFEDTPRGAQAVLNANNNGTPYVIPNEITKDLPMPSGTNIIRFEQIKDLVEKELSPETNILKTIVKKLIYWIRKKLRTPMQFISNNLRKSF